MIIFGPAWHGHRLNLNPRVKGIGWWYPHLHPPPSTYVCARRVASTHTGHPPRCVLAVLVFATFACTCRAGMLPAASTTSVCTCRAGCQCSSNETMPGKTTPGKGHAENSACYKNRGWTHTKDAERSPTSVCHCRVGVYHLCMYLPCWLPMPRTVLATKPSTGKNWISDFRNSLII